SAFRNLGCALRQYVLAKRTAQVPEGAKRVVVSVRPEKIHLSQDAPRNEGNCYSGYVKHMMYLGTHLHCVVQLQTGNCLTVMQPSRAEHQLTANAPVFISWRPDDCLALVG
ncbi:MAG: TOBE domain-containing protein, partial [Cyanobacteria bacterium J06626_18]